MVDDCTYPCLIGLQWTFYLRGIVEMDSLDRLWELWEGERVDSPYAELMTYQSEINNGGHSQFFFQY